MRLRGSGSKPTTVSRLTDYSNGHFLNTLESLGLADRPFPNNFLSQLSISLPTFAPIRCRKG